MRRFTNMTLILIKHLQIRIITIEHKSDFAVHVIITFARLARHGRHKYKIQ